MLRSMRHSASFHLRRPPLCGRLQLSAHCAARASRAAQISSCLPGRSAAARAHGGPIRCSSGRGGGWRGKRACGQAWPPHVRALTATRAGFPSAMAARTALDSTLHWCALTESYHVDGMVAAAGQRYMHNACRACRARLDLFFFERMLYMRMAMLLLLAAMQSTIVLSALQSLRANL